MSKESKIILSVAAVVVVAIVALITFVNSNQQDPAVIMERLVKSDSHTTGAGEVQVVEFGDFQCPACGQVYPEVKKLKEEYKDEITFVYRNFPLPNHPNARAAAEAAEAAGTQGKFWEMHDKLFESQNEWSALADPTSAFVKYAEDLALDVDRFKEDITTEANKARIDSDQSDGYAVGVSGTPTFFINGKVQSQFDYDSLKNSIEAELK